MTTKLSDDERLVNALLPDFAVGCRRPTPGNGYLEALTRENVRVVTERISHVVPEGIVLTTGEVIKIDTFICATGFDLSFTPSFEIVGRQGKTMAEQWKTKPTAYLSLAVPNFPNYFSELNSLSPSFSSFSPGTHASSSPSSVFLGPNSPVGHGSILPIIEHTTKYVINFLKKIQTQDICSVTPSQAATADYDTHVSTFMQRTAWATPCRSWFKNGTVDGPITALHPGSRIHWFHMLGDIRFEDWEFEYRSANRFRYLGNGFSIREAAGRDTTRYFQDPEEGYRAY